MKSLLRVSIILFLLALGNSQADKLIAQSCPPPPPTDKGLSGNSGPMYGPSPIGDGAWVLVALVIGYGVQTYTSRRKQQHSESEE